MDYVPVRMRRIIKILTSMILIAGPEMIFILFLFWLLVWEEEVVGVGSMIVHTKVTPFF